VKLRALPNPVVGDLEAGAEGHLLEPTKSLKAQFPIARRLSEQSGIALSGIFVSTLITMSHSDGILGTDTKDVES